MNKDQIFLLLVASVIVHAIVFLILFTLASVYGDHTNDTIVIYPTPDQRGGNVTPNEFPITHYTNDTNRTLEVNINLNGISDEELREIEFNGIKDFTVFVAGNKFWFKESFPLLQLTDNATINIPLDDGVLDSYRVCVYFGNYDRDSECTGMNTSKNVTSKEIDMTYQLKFVHEDIKKEIEGDQEQEDG